MKNNYNKTKKWNRNDRPDHQPGQRMEYERNRKRILATQTICGICGQPVDKSLKYPHPFSPTIDHIVPCSRGGHPSAIENLQLAHFCCNTRKSDKLQEDELRRRKQKNERDEKLSASDPLNLPWTINWACYKSEEDGKNNGSVLRDEADRLRRSGYVLTARGIFRK